MSSKLDQILAQSLDATAPPDLGRDVLRFVAETSRILADVPRIDLAATRGGLCSLRLGRGHSEATDATARRICEQARAELDEFFAGERSFFAVPVDLGAIPAFQRSVLEVAQQIPSGEVRSYQWIATRIRRPGAARAVGTALGRNPVPLIVPCHRVLRSDGSLGGYALGVERKRQLLLLESALFAFVGDARAQIVCRTGCARERVLSEDRRIAFASLGEARAAGYEACLCTAGLDAVPGRRSGAKAPAYPAPSGSRFRRG